MGKIPSLSSRIQIIAEKSKTYQANVKARRTRRKQQNSTLYFAKPVLFWSTGGSYNGSIISKKTR
jgi:hypothetical protein